MCECPIHCKYCGAKLKRDALGYHYCPTHNCQWSMVGPGLECDGKGRRAALAKEKNP